MFVLMLKQFNKAKHSGHIMGIWGTARGKNAYGLRILKNTLWSAMKRK